MTEARRREALRAALERAFEVTALEIRDDSHHHVGHRGHNGGGHFAVRIVSEAFAGNGRLARHRMVYQAAAALMGGEIHALTIEAKTPREIGDG